MEVSMEVNTEGVDICDNIVWLDLYVDLYVHVDKVFVSVGKLEDYKS